MAVSYNKLWKLLVDKKMSKADLRNYAGMNQLHSQFSEKFVMY